eukprot:g17614.t1
MEPLLGTGLLTGAARVGAAAESAPRVDAPAPAPPAPAPSGPPPMSAIPVSSGLHEGQLVRVYNVGAQVEQGALCKVMGYVQQHDGTAAGRDDGGLYVVRDGKGQLWGVPLRSISSHIQFEPTAEWKEVPKDMLIPAGLEVKMDLEKGVTLARLAGGVQAKADEPRSELERELHHGSATGGGSTGAGGVARSTDLVLATADPSLTGLVPSPAGREEQEEI